MFGNLKKSSQLIQKHTIVVKNERVEHSEWLRQRNKLSDDSWNYAEQCNFPLNYKEKIFDTIKTWKYLLCV